MANKIYLTGRIVRDPELKNTNTGTEFCNFTIAVDRRVKKGDEKQSDFFDCTAWQQSGVFVHQYFKKGDGINIIGRMESRKYTDKEGKNRVAWGVTVEETEFPLSRAGQNGSTGAGQSSGQAAPNFEEIADGNELPF